MSAPRPEGPPPPPAVQKLRIRFAKRGRLRFSSHRDFQRSLERALRRADIPMAYSAGFTKHPKISFAGAAPTGAASEAEFVDISVVEFCDPEAVAAALDEALPDGFVILEVVEAQPGALADRLQASEWQIALPGITAVEAAAAVEAFLARDEVLVEKMTKSGRREIDTRSATVDLAALADVGSGPDDPPRSGENGQACAILHLVVRHTTPSVRPDDVVTALRVVADLAPSSPAILTRLAQGPLDANARRVCDPLTVDRGAIAVPGRREPELGDAHPETESRLPSRPGRRR